MDGTLLNSQGAISPRNKQAILAAIAQGTRVVLASGRPLEGMNWALEELGMTGKDDYVACYNGFTYAYTYIFHIVKAFN